MIHVGPFLLAWLVAAGGPAFAIDPRDFGVRCDGHSDDAPALNEALKAAGPTRGHVVLSPSATPCLLSRALVIADGITLEAAPGTVILKPTTANVSVPMLLSVGNHVTIRGVDFDGGGSSHPNRANVVQGFHVANVLFDRIAVRHTSGAGLVMSSGIIASRVQNSVFADIGNAWRVSGRPEDRRQGVIFCCGADNYGNSVVSNDFSDIGLDALQFSDQKHFSITGNTFYLENDQLAALSSSDYAAGIFLLRSTRGVVDRNNINDAQGNCIDAPGLSETSITSNTIIGCGNSAIGLFSSVRYAGPPAPTANVLIVSNTISDIRRWAFAKRLKSDAIAVPAEARHVIVHDNTIR